MIPYSANKKINAYDLSILIYNYLKQIPEIEIDKLCSDLKVNRVDLPFGHNFFYYNEFRKDQTTWIILKEEYR
jgi:hypothetical protein